MDMDKNAIIEALEPVLEQMGCFLTEVTVSSGNDSEIFIEKKDGIVEMEDCVSIDHFIHETFSQDEEDYSLTVSSAGLDRPLKVFGQFVKAIGSKVTLSLKGGKRLVATLKAATEDALTVTYTAREAVDGKKKKEMVAHEETIPMTEVNSVIPYIEFE